MSPEPLNQRHCPPFVCYNLHVESIACVSEELQVFRRPPCSTASSSGLIVPSVQSEIYELYEAGVWLVGEHLPAHLSCGIGP